MLLAHQLKNREALSVPSDEIKMMERKQFAEIITGDIYAICRYFWNVATHK
jgi:hypothetical protein